MNQDPIGLWGGNNLYQFAPNVQDWVDVFGLARRNKNLKILGRNLIGKKKWVGKQVHHLIPEELTDYPLLKDIGFKMNSVSNAIMLPNKANNILLTIEAIIAGITKLLRRN